MANDRGSFSSAVSDNPKVKSFYRRLIPLVDANRQFFTDGATTWIENPPRFVIEPANDPTDPPMGKTPERVAYLKALVTGEYIPLTGDSERLTRTINRQLKSNREADLRTVGESDEAWEIRHAQQEKIQAENAQLLRDIEELEEGKFVGDWNEFDILPTLLMYKHGDILGPAILAAAYDYSSDFNDGNPLLSRSPFTEAYGKWLVFCCRVFELIGDWEGNGDVLEHFLSNAVRQIGGDPNSESARVLDDLSTANGEQCQPAGPPPCYVRLREMAIVTGQTKSNMRKLKRNKIIPPPDAPGRNGQADQWLWDKVRPILAQHSNRIIPERYPGDLFAR